MPPGFGTGTLSGNCRPPRAAVPTTATTRTARVRGLLVMPLCAIATPVPHRNPGMFRSGCAKRYRGQVVCLRPSGRRFRLTRELDRDLIPNDGACVRLRPIVLE